MKINSITQSTPMFKSVREDRNTVSQLKENNNYSLTDPNQRRINKAIENLAKQRGEENIKFLLDVAENLKYQGHVPNKSPEVKNDWSQKLKGATEESLAHSNPILRNKYNSEIERIFSPKPLTKDEEKINTYKKRILERAKDHEKVDEIGKNLDYFITSSETPIEQKKYVMKRLDYFMSPKYKINPQLKDKKSEVLYEITNDIAINTPESKVPNIKAVNQKTHGMCAAISIVRKAVAYEDKPNYVDALLSELDDTNTVMVYDRQNLGSGKRIPVNKIKVDFDYAQERGYRIIDASTLQWMNIAGMYGVQNENLHDFSAFDKQNFDAFHDAFFTKKMSENDLVTKQNYFQVLTKAKNDIGSVKSQGIKEDIKNAKNRQNRDRNIRELARNNSELRDYISKIMPKTKKEDRNVILADMFKLAQPISSKIDKLPDNLKKYAFIPNEEQSQKVNKIQQYFKEQHGLKNVDSDVLSDKAVLIVDILEDTNNINNELNTNTSQSSKVAHARKMYEAESVYRASILAGLMDKDTRNDVLIMNNIPDKETRVLEGFDKVINRMEKHNDKKLLNHFASYLGTTPDNKAEVIKGIKALKNSLEYMINDEMDSVYQSMGFGTKNEVLANDIKDCMNEINDGDKNELARTAKCLHMGQDKKAVVKKLSSMASKLENEPQNQKAYIEAFNGMGYKSQTEAFVDVFNAFKNSIESENSEEKAMFLESFKKANGLSDNATANEIAGKINEVCARFNNISQTFATAGYMLEVPNEDGTPYFSTSVESIVTKKLEKEGKLVPVKTMKKFQDRFAKIDKIRSSDEFSSRQGKISDPTLYNMSDDEKQAVKTIEKNINFMYGDVVRKLEKQYREIKEPLEEMARYVGTNSGTYWVGADGNSGLFSDQQIKIFEQLTDRPHYEVEDLTVATDMIKNGTHSGISSSSVFHDRQGGHAQYVADVVKDDKTGKDILFHDNTWGASEHENTWIDSDGNMRTDYSDRRGGELGYITNKDWRNGNYVENLIYKKGHVSPDNTESKVYHRMNPGKKGEYDFTLMGGIILEGNNREYKDIAASIKDEIFIPDSAQVKNLEKLAKTMTKLEIQKAIFKNKSLGEEYKKNYETIVKRITPSTFNKGIQSEADYNALADNDPVKVAFEKAAVRDNFDDATMYRELAGVKSVKEVHELRNKQRKVAYKDFRYSFYKDGAKNDVLAAALLNNSAELSSALYEPIKKYNVEVDVEAMRNVLKGSTELQKDELPLYNGSLKNTIKILTDRVSKQYDENIPQSENSVLAKKEFMTNLNNFFEKNVYYNKEDMNADTTKTKAIRQWIDDSFDPQSDENFVEIYRSIQDMTSDEFDALTKNIDDKYLGMKKASGYDILRKVLAANDSAESSLRNVLFYDEFSRDIDMSKTKPNFRYKKLERNERGRLYVGPRSFDDLYRTMSMNLNQLEYPQMFAKWKDKNYRQYGAFPAYPKLDFSEDATLNGKVQKTEELVESCFNTINNQKNLIFDIKLANMLNDYVKEIPADRNLTEKEDKTIKTIVTSFVEANITNSDFDIMLDAGYKIIENDKPVNINDYMKNLAVIIDTMKEIEKFNPLESFENAREENTKAINYYMNTVMNMNIPSRHQKVVKDDAKKWFALEMASRKNSNGFDKNKDVLELQDKIMENAKVDSTKELLEDFVEIMDAVSDAKNNTLATKKSKEMINYQLNKLNSMSNKYIDKYIAPEAQNGLRANINDWFRKELVGGKKQSVKAEDVYAAKQQYIQDFKKHYITSHPSEVLEDFLLLSAKDAEQSDVQTAYATYLKTELDLAKYVAIQDSLMQAVKMGNAAQVKEYFDEFVVAPYGDAVVSMDSDPAIDYMIRSLILDKNTETAKMFVEKLGLGERAIELELKTIAEVNPKGKIDSMVSVLKDSAKLSAIINKEYAKLSSVIDNSETPDKEISKAKRSISRQTKDFTNKDGVKSILSALDETKELIKESSEQTRSEILTASVNKALAALNEQSANSISEQQQYFDIVNLIYNFLLELQFPANSKGKDLQSKVYKEQQELIKYNNEQLTKLASENSDLQMTKKEI